MVLMKFITSTWLHFKTKIAWVIFKNISKSEEPDMFDTLTTLNYILMSNDYSKINVGWNSPNENIETKFENVQDEIIELRKIDKILSSKIDKKPVSGYLDLDDKKIDVCLYFKNKQNLQVNVSESITNITTLVSSLLRRYEEIRKDTGTYEYMIISVVFKQLQKTLLSLSKLK